MQVEDATNLGDLDGAGHIPSVNTNFFEHFGTTGCSLGCESKKSFETDLQREKGAVPPKIVRKSRKEHGLRRPWFTSSELEGSKRSGCGSCTVLGHILAAVFPECVSDTADLYSYSVNPMWELRCRKINVTKPGPKTARDPESIVQLFQPRSTYSMPYTTTTLTLDRCDSALQGNADVPIAPWTYQICCSTEGMGRRMSQHPQAMCNQQHPLV